MVISGSPQEISSRYLYSHQTYIQISYCTTRDLLVLLYICVLLSFSSSNRDLITGFL